MPLKSFSWQRLRQPNFATMSRRPPRVDEPRHRATGYELRDASGKVLSSCDETGPLLRHLDQKRDCVVVRCRDASVVARSPVSEPEMAEQESA